MDSHINSILLADLPEFEKPFSGRQYSIPPRLDPSGGRIERFAIEYHPSNPRDPKPAVVEFENSKHDWEKHDLPTGQAYLYDIPSCLHIRGVNPKTTNAPKPDPGGRYGICYHEGEWQVRKFPSD